MAINKRKHFFNYIIWLLAFAAGFCLAYVLIFETIIIPINYPRKFSQYHKQYDAQEYLGSYVDLDNGISFEYSRYYKIYQPGSYPEYTDLPALNLEITQGEIRHYLFKRKLEKNTTLLDFAKETELFPWQDQRDVKYTEVTINNYEAVKAEFEVTEKHKELSAYVKGGEQKIIDEPLGFKGTMIYIKYKDYVYIWKTGSVNNMGAEKDFDLMVNSFKILF